MGAAVCAAMGANDCYALLFFVEVEVKVEVFNASFAPFLIFSPMHRS